MRDEEVFAAKSIKTYHENNGSDIVTYSEPLQDPPDILMNLDGSSMGIEVTKVDENSLNNRTAYFRGYDAFIRSVIEEYREQIPDNVSYFVTIAHSSTPVGKIRKNFKKFFLDELIGSALSKEKYEFIDGSVKIKFSKMNRQVEKASFSMMFSNIPVPTSRNIDNFQLDSMQPDLQLLNLVNNCISIKSDKCRGIDTTLELALLDCYANKYCESDAEIFQMYSEAFERIPDRGVFNKIYVVLSSGSVQEF
ncbi:hypothetical protein [Shewanella algae]|uniref:hypothetical protein n=1 Tax=Shewanella algae TaxID=38313 RepID=UPI0031F5CCEF